MAVAAAAASPSLSVSLFSPSASFSLTLQIDDANQPQCRTEQGGKKVGRVALPPRHDYTCAACQVPRMYVGTFPLWYVCACAHDFGGGNGTASSSVVAGFFGFKTSAPHFIYILFRIITPMKSCGQNQSGLVAQYVWAEPGRTEAGPMGRARSELKSETAAHLSAGVSLSSECAGCYASAI